MADEVLNGQVFEAALDAFLAAFADGGDFDQFLEFRMNDRLVNYVGENEALRKAVFAVLKAYRARGEVIDLVLAAKEYRPKQKALLDLYDRLRAEPKKIAENLERIVKPHVPIFPAGFFVGEMTKNLARVVQISYNCPDGEVFGTGFLVGPDLILTNYHVMSRILSGEIDAANAVIAYDHAISPVSNSLVYLHTVLAPDWILSASPFGRYDESGTQPEPTVDELDYALIRLAQPIGDSPRGWINLPAAPKAWPAKMPLFVLQYPALPGEAVRRPVSVAFDMESETSLLMPNETRVKHSVNTDHGSSGSPIFDANWTCVALHHAGDPLFNSPLNQGIPIDMIVAHLGRAGVTLEDFAG